MAIRDVVRDALPDPAVRLLRRALRRPPPMHWQAQRGRGNDQRWELIRDTLDPDDRTLLDIGCNMGLLTIAAAKHGLDAVGVDKNPDAIRTAKSSAGGATFIQQDLTLPDLDALDEYDVVVLLSVHHQWVAMHGPDFAQTMLESVWSKARSRFYFEAASIRSKYGEHSPRIVDGDEASIVDHNVQVLRGLEGVRTVEYLGSTSTVESSEGFRCLFLARR